MFLRFSASNYRSLREKQELSLVAATSLKQANEQLLATPIPGTSVLRAAGIYGANASGKTNVLKALRFMVRAVLNSQTTWKPEHPISRPVFALDPTSAERPSEFEVEMLIDGVRYTYGFALNSERVTREYLHAYPHGRRRVWFERDVTSSPELVTGKLLVGENRAIWNLTRPNSLFLSAAAQNNHKMLAPIHSWFQSAFAFVEPGDETLRMAATLKSSAIDSVRGDVLRLLVSADLGICGLELRDEEVPDEAIKMFEAIRTAVPTFPFPDKKHRSIQLSHKTCDGTGSVPLEWHSESKGTRTLFTLGVDVALALGTGGVLCIDELEDSLHPIIAINLLRTFTDPKSNPRGAQLIFTTHNTHLLGERALRRDQVWFTEKDNEGATRLYPLTDFKPRLKENLEFGYLQGRYGAIPFLANQALLSGT